MECKYGLSGHSLYRTIKEYLDQAGLDISDCRGQAYDGAASVSGKGRGLAVYFTRDNPKALYTHCSSHRLNLAVVASCSLQQVRNVMQQIKEITYFINGSVRRTKCLQKNIELHAPKSNRKKLVDVCRTRWVARIEGMGLFEELYISIYYALLEMKENITEPRYNNDTSSKADTFFKLISDFNFIVNLVITRNVLDYLLPLTIQLQKKDHDVARALEQIKTLKSTCFKLRQMNEKYHSDWYTIALTLASEVGIDEAQIKKKRTTGKQVHRPNPPASSPSEYHRLSLTLPLLDHLISDLNYRFPGNELTPYCGLYIVPYIMIKFQHVWRKEFLVFFNFYCDDLPHFNSLNAELDLWFTHWELKSKTANVPDSVATTLKSVETPDFPNIFEALKLLATLPVTTCECERSFSALRHIKTWNRSNMTNDRLNGLAALFIHREINLSIDEVIDRFAECGNRRLNLK